MATVDLLHMDASSTTGSQPEEDEEVCPVCWETPLAEIELTSCGHQVCSSCIDKLRTRGYGRWRCPICRRQYSDGHICPVHGASCPGATTRSTEDEVRATLLLGTAAFLMGILSGRERVTQQSATQSSSRDEDRLDRPQSQHAIFGFLAAAAGRRDVPGFTPWLPRTRVHDGPMAVSPSPVPRARPADDGFRAWMDDIIHDIASEDGISAYTD